MHRIRSPACQHAYIHQDANISTNELAIPTTGPPCRQSSQLSSNQRTKRQCQERHHAHNSQNPESEQSRHSGRLSSNMLDNPDFPCDYEGESESHHSGQLNNEDEDNEDEDNEDEDNEDEDNEDEDNEDNTSCDDNSEAKEFFFISNTEAIGQKVQRNQIMDEQSFSSSDSNNDGLSSTSTSSDVEDVEQQDQFAESSCSIGSNTTAPDNTLLDIYENLQHLNTDSLGLDKYSIDEKVQVDLLHTLKKLKAPLICFQEVLAWASRAHSMGYQFSGVTQPTRKTLLEKLCRKNCMTGLQPQEKKLRLPQSKQVVKMIYYDAKAVFSSLLSCPILNQDENYLFHEENPFSCPPDTTGGTVGDINTSRGYIKTHASIIKNNNEDVLLPCIFALDKTQCDTYGRLAMEPLTMSYGLMKHKIRSSPSAMRILGYINHDAIHDHDTNLDNDLDNNDNNDLANVVLAEDGLTMDQSSKAASSRRLNDYHAQIQFILKESGFLSLQEKGFKWKLHFKGNVYPVTFRTYIPFIVGDTEGHDRLCGHYTARFDKVKQLCRSCICPTSKMGHSKADYMLRTPAQVKRDMSHPNRVAVMQSQSQHILKSAFDNVRFGSHNRRGIFGACPGEILHLVLIGWFKYAMESFVGQAGAASSACTKYDALCAKIGTHLQRQSDQDKARTNYPKGFSSVSNLTGAEIPGCIMVMLFAFHTSRYKEIFSSRKVYRGDKGLGNSAHITDWVTLLSGLLQWHQWLKQDKIPRLQVKRSIHATKWLMRQFKFIAPRLKGMKNNTIKMHLVLHIAHDILDHGVPQNVNSAFAESAHIPLAKDTSRNTQKRAISFTKQAGSRYVENLAISLASHEIIHNNNPIHTDRENQERTPRTESLKYGRNYTIHVAHNGDVCSEWVNRSCKKTGTVKLLPHVLNFLVRHCLPHVPNQRLLCFTEYLDESEDIHQRYRAHPKYMGSSWNDYVMVNWVGFDNKPARIHTFVNLSNMGRNGTARIRASTGQAGIVPGRYAIVESYERQAEDANDDYADTIIGRFNRLNIGNTEESILYLVHIDSFLHPVIGMPNIPSVAPANQRQQQREKYYLIIVRNRNQWPTCWDSMINSCFNNHQEGIETDESGDDE
jgi:Plavaka transposase